MADLASDVLLKRTWLENVFADRNKVYGAYYLRILYGKNVGLAGIYAFTIFGGLILGYYFYTRYQNSKEEEVVFTAAPVAKKVASEKPAEKKKEPIIEIPKEVKIETKEYLSYEPKEDELVKTKLEAVDDVLQSNASSVSQEGEKIDVTGEVFVPEEQKPVEIVQEEYVDISEIEEWPHFPDGAEEGMMRFLQQNIKYPSTAIKMGLQGKVQVQFSVEKDGSLSNIRVVRGIDPSLDAEAERVVRMMPKWTPGMLNGKPAKVKAMTIPITFTLE